MKYIILAIVLRVSWVSSDDILPEVNESSSSQGSEEEVPSLALIYDMKKFPGQVEGYCETGDDDGSQLHIENMARLNIPRFTDETNTRRINITWDRDDIKANMKARGLKCSISTDKENIYNVLAPLLDKQSKYVPVSLTATINDGEDLNVRFREGTARYPVMWKKELVVGKNWSEANLTKNNELVISYDKLSDQGLYSIIRSTGTSDAGKDKSEYGSLVVIIRKCPRDMYGEKCDEHCPECMYGGICHHKTGKCVCSPGRYGKHCENSCNNTLSSNILIGPKCNILIEEPKGKQICLPTPYGCSCAPGKKGVDCTEECPEGKWGVNCEYSCNHCKPENCNPVTGVCQEGPEEPCAGGPLGLPRLRNKPVVKETGDASRRTVTFHPWSNKTGNGELPEGASIVGYKVILNDKIVHSSDSFILAPTTVTLTKLKRGEYEVAALVVVELDNTTCLNNGTYRGTHIQKEAFNITCPKKPMPPSVVTYESSGTELSLAWQYWSCDSEKEMAYQLHIVSDDLAEEQRTTTKSFKFTDLKPGQMYNVTFQSCPQDGSECSETITISFFTEPPTPPAVLESSGPTSKIRLPIVLHPPACQYVVVVEAQGDLDDEIVKKKSLDVVTAYSDEHPNGACFDVGQDIQRHGTTESGPDDLTAYIAGGVYVQNDTHNDFEIGNGEENNKPLEDEKNYKVTVVTETKSGDRKTYSVSKPVDPKKAAAAGISGFLYGGLVFLFLILLFVWTNRVRRSRRREITENNQNEQDNEPMDILGTEEPRSGVQQPKVEQK